MADCGNKVIRKAVGNFCISQCLAIVSAQKLTLLDQVNGTSRRINTNELKSHQKPRLVVYLYSGAYSIFSWGSLQLPEWVYKTLPCA